MANNDDDVVSHDFLIGSPVFSHLRADAHTLLDERRDKNNETDCIQGPAYENNGNNTVESIMVHRMNNVPTPDNNRPRASIHEAQCFQDPVSDPCFLDPIDEV